MQPYYFPYIGYWQLLNAVDKYVIFDDVNYIKRGWINRNRILFRGEPRYFNVYLKAVSQNKLINQIEVIEHGENDKNLGIIKEAYNNAPYFEGTFPIIKKILENEEKNLARFNGFLIKTIRDYLGMNTTLLYSSDIEKDQSLKGQYKILTICEKLGATEYINAIGGMELYDSDVFRRRAIDLFFLKTGNIEYKQFNNEFVSNLSIIDVLMFNPIETIRSYLNNYELISKD